MQSNEKLLFRENKVAVLFKKIWGSELQTAWIKKANKE